MTGTVYVTAGSGSYHTDLACKALDTARLNSRTGKVRVIPADEATAQQRPACLVCTAPAATEWVVTKANLGELWELIGPSKPYYSLNETADRAVCDGLTIREHKGLPRVVARFGDTIRHDRGRYTVHPATEDVR
ncbi:hypothetical protein [Kitasatospora sp. NPDC001175]|uniref:hypothetical protein n=1 Tax=Kitasatospora sp. NPDC001175 TaxID=3157103 RepID=UPI003CFCE509